MWYFFRKSTSFLEVHIPEFCFLIFIFFVKNISIRDDFMSPHTLLCFWQFCIFWSVLGQICVATERDSFKWIFDSIILSYFLAICHGCWGSGSPPGAMLWCISYVFVDEFTQISKNTYTPPTLFPYKNTNPHLSKIQNIWEEPVFCTVPLVFIILLVYIL